MMKDGEKPDKPMEWFDTLESADGVCVESRFLSECATEWSRDTTEMRPTAYRCADKRVIAPVKVRDEEGWGYLSNRDVE